uniref:Ig-like domain-containing protein n=1 Tax=Podarcis muralis TaxID=64176 RepID=A0A670KGA8_PODMU
TPSELALKLPLQRLPSSVLTVHPQKALVELGGSVRLTCSTDCPGGKVQWEGLDIEQGEVFSNKTHSILTIAKATVSMEGAKFCTGQCRGTSGQKKVDLQVYSFPDALQLDSEPKIMRTGQPARLVCSLSKVYPPGSLTLTWFRGEERLEATKPPATTQGLPLLSTEPPTTTSTASPTPEPLPETSSLSPTRNPVAAVQTSSQNSGTGANTVQVPVLTSTETPATSQPPRLTDEPPTTAPVPATASSLATRAAEKPHSSSATTDPSRDPCRPVITPVPTQGSTGGTLQITCLTADCGKDVQVRWVETPVAKSRYRQEEAEGRSTLVVESVSLEHQGVYRCVAIASQPRMASLTISIVPNGEYTGAPCPLILASAKALLTGSLLGVVITGYVARRLWRRRG